MQTVNPDGITAGIAAFVHDIRHEDLPEEARRIGRRCILDGMGQYIAGLRTDAVEILRDHILEQGGKAEALLPGGDGISVPAPQVGCLLATAGHALDWDDTQMTRDPRHVNGLLAHPTNAPLAAALAMSQRMNATGQDVMLAFQTGFEVECKLAEWMRPEIYKRGMHASATVATFAACAATAKLLRLPRDTLAHALGISASTSAAAIRANVGTMTKPYHFGVAAQAGMTAALLAARGLRANAHALDGDFGFVSVFANGVFEEKLADGLGAPLTIVEPGVLVKPYPSGILSHQAMDAMLRLVTENDLKPDEVVEATFYAGTNILKPLSYARAADHLQAKFCMPALLSMILLRRRAGTVEFQDEFVAGSDMQDMQSRIRTRIDDKIEGMGFDKIRSRIEVSTTDGRMLVEWADERYRGGPELPMSDRELEDKFRSATERILTSGQQDEAIEAVWALETHDTRGPERLLDALS